MEQRIVCILVVIVLVGSAGPKEARAQCPPTHQTYYTATTPNASDTSPGTSSEPFRTISKGVSVLAPGDTLIVRSGTYAESLVNSIPSGTASAPVTLRAEGETIIKPGTSARCIELSSATKHHIVIDGFVLDGSNLAAENFVLSGGANNVTLQKSIVRNCVGNCLHIVQNGTTNNRIAWNTISGSGSPFDAGVYLTAQQNIVEGNEIFNKRRGIYCASSGANQGSNNILRKNRIHNCSISGIEIAAPSNIAYNNVTYDNGSFGINVVNVANTKIYNNTTTGNAYGIYVQASSTNSEVWNNISYPNTILNSAGAQTNLANNTTVDPKFVDATSKNFTLQYTSPAIDAATSIAALVPALVTDDLEGESRPVDRDQDGMLDGTYDAGAYESPYTRCTAYYYVATTGSNTQGNGTEGNPWRTINHALPSLANGGKCLVIRGGTYEEPTLETIPAGSSWQAPVVLMAYPCPNCPETNGLKQEQVIMRPPVGWAAVMVFGEESSPHHVIVHGLTLDASNTTHHAVSITGKCTNDPTDPNPCPGYAHHIRFQYSAIRKATKSGVMINPPLAYPGAPALTVGFNEFIGTRIHNNGPTDPAHPLYSDASGAHALYISAGDNLIDQCEIDHNTGWGVHAYGEEFAPINNNVVRNSYIHDNSLHNPERGSGIEFFRGSGNIAYNNIVSGNAYGIGIGNGASNTKVYNNTLAFNNFYGIFMRAAAGSGTEFVNNITFGAIYGYYIDGDNNPITPPRDVTISHSLSFGNSGGDFQPGHPGDASLIADAFLTGAGCDPLFVNAAVNDYRLQHSSPAKDTGSLLTEILEGYDGASRPQGGGYDIGAYESY